jgi:PAB1-binding protein PBP1
VRERQLQRWDGGADGSDDVTADLESSSGVPWDQFKANEKLFGVKTNYDESYYTTNIDRSHPQFKEREAEAERLAREISTSTTTNAHVAEERGLKVPDEDEDEDEESK